MARLPIKTHEGRLRAMKNDMAIELKKLERMKKMIELNLRAMQFLELQISFAEKQGLTHFDDEKFLDDRRS